MQTEAPAATEAPASAVEEVIATAPAIATLTAAPTTIPPTPTETQLPPLELPSPVLNVPALLTWDGVPTYPGDSKPGYFFRVNYNPDIWALTSDSYGSPAIAQRGIEYCVIAPLLGGGLPSNMRVDHEIRNINGIAYEVSIASTSDGVKQFVSYVGGDANIYTGFQVSFQQGEDLCLQEAEVVLATLISVPEAQATPAVPAP
jgi:predicted Zn-dependent peptidase